MLRILLIVSSYLMTSHCLTVSAGYTVGTRSRDYNPGSYSTSGGFVGLSSSGSPQRSSSSSSSASSSSQGSSSLSSLSKDTHAELTDQLTSSGSYGGAGSHRYSTSTGGHSAGGSDDNTQGLATGYSSSNTDNINSISSPYTNTNTNANSNDIYTSTDVNPYSGSSDSSYGSAGHGSQSLSNYASHSIGADHNSIDYNSYGASSSSSAGSFGPKVASFNPKSHPHSHSGHSGHYGIGSGMKFLSNPHPNYPASNHLNSYPGHIGAYSGGRHGGPGLPSPAALTSHGSHGGPGLSYPGSHGFNDGPRYSGSSVNYLSNHGSGPGNFIHGGGPSSPVHRNIPSFLLGAASSVNPTFVKSPSSFFSGSFGPKAGNKFVIIKDAGGAGPSHLMHPETGGGFSGGMFAGNGGYKVRSAGPYSAGSTNHFTSGNYPSHPGHASSIGYSGSVGHHHAPAAASSATGSYFGY